MRFLLGRVRPHRSVSASRTPCRTPFARLRDSPALGRSGSFTGVTMPDRSSETAAMRESSPEDASSVSTRTGEDEDESELEEEVAATAASLVNLCTRASAVGIELPRPNRREDLVQVTEGSSKLVSGVGGQRDVLRFHMTP